MLIDPNDFAARLSDRSGEIVYYEGRHLDTLAHCCEVGTTAQKQTFCLVREMAWGAHMRGAAVLVQRRTPSTTQYIAVAN